MKSASLFLGAVLLSLAACTNHSSKPPGAGAPAGASQSSRVPAVTATGLDIAAPLKLHIRIDKEPSCRFKGPSGIVGQLKTEMQGNTFRIFTDSRTSWNSNETVEAWVSIPHLQELSTAGAGDVVIESPINEPSVDMDLSGASNLDVLAIQTPRLQLELSGTGNVLVRAGQVTEGSYSISGTGNIEAFELKTRKAHVEVSGAGRAALTAEEQLDASISGAGMIRYKGNPAIQKDISGIGTLQNAN